jgi:hypothetical protein
VNVRLEGEAAVLVEVIATCKGQTRTKVANWILAGVFRERKTFLVGRVMNATLAELDAAGEHQRLKVVG